MKTWDVFITIPKNSKINDPEGNTIGAALLTLGFDGVGSLRAGRILSFQMQAETEEGALARLKEMVKHQQNPLGINPTLETWEAKFTEVEA